MSVSDLEDLDNFYDDEPEPELPKSRLGKLKNGVDWSLEEAADEILADSRRQGNEPEGEAADYEFLSVGQLDRRRQREIYNKNGYPEPHLYSGLYRRAYNPLMTERKRRGDSQSENVDTENIGHGYNSVQQPDSPAFSWGRS